MADCFVLSAQYDELCRCDWYTCAERMRTRQTAPSIRLNYLP